MTSYIGSGGSYYGSGVVETTPGRGIRKARGFFESTPTTPVMITDGLSQTLMAGERPPPGNFQAGQWYQSRRIFDLGSGPDGVLVDGFGGRYGPGRLENPEDRGHYWSFHRGGANFVLGDASVRFIRYGAADTVTIMASRSGGESLAED